MEATVLTFTIRTLTSTKNKHRQFGFVGKSSNTCQKIPPRPHWANVITDDDRKIATVYQ